MLTTEGRVSRHNYRNVEVKPENVTPLYDNLLVRRIYDTYEGQIIAPGVEQTVDGRWVRKTDSGPRKGVVLAAGRGDKITKLRCECCGKVYPYPPVQNLALWSCLRCHTVNSVSPFESNNGRHRLAVGVGDTIIYPRFESSHVVIDGHPYTFVREADVMAVIEPDEPQHGGPNTDKQWTDFPKRRVFGALREEDGPSYRAMLEGAI